MNFKRFGAAAMAVFMMLSVFAMAFAGGAAATTAESDLQLDGTDTIDGFNASSDESEIVIYETTANSDTVDDFDDLSLEVSYENNTLAEYDYIDAEISGDDDDTTPLTLQWEVDHSDLEKLPGDAGELTIADAEITELEDDEEATEVTTADQIEITFANSYAAVTAFSEDDSVVSFDAGDDGGLFGWGAEAASTEISDDVGIDGTNTDIHVHADNGTFVETFDDSVESADDGDRVGLLMTSTVNGQAIVVFNEEPGEFIGGDEADEDEDTYGVYHGDGHVVINTGDDRFDDTDEEASVSMVSGVDVDSSILQDDLGYSWFQANGLSFDAFSLSDITDNIPFVGGLSLSGAGLAGLLVVGGRRRLA